MKKILVFPVNSYYLKTVLMNNLNSDFEIIGATSNLEDKIDWDFGTLEYLPSINNIEFSQELSQLFNRYKITHILSLHPLVRLYLSKNLIKINPSIVLEPIRIENILQEKLKQWTNLKSRPSLFKIQTNMETMMHSSVVAAIARVHEIYGETPQDKIDEILKIFPSLPMGDVVEIGVFFGKSALLLSELSSIFKIGNVLLVDPWDTESSIQNDESGLLENLSIEWDWNFIFNSFLMNISKFATDNNFNYIRSTSSKAEQIYTNSHSVTTQEFGEINFTGGISLLHIDGNHNYSDAKKDIENWVPHVKNNGWVIFDDYNWDMGNGVTKAVDEFCSENPQLFGEFYVVGRSLYARITKND
jgi:hypothetical protein